jgi:DNA-binding response OmpR family regulator
MDMERAGVNRDPGGHVISGRRESLAPPAAGSWPDRVIRVGNLSLDVGRLEADLGRGRVPLTRLEFLFLQELVRHAGRAVSKGQLLSSVWGYDSDPGSNVVGVCVRRLRGKLGDQLITTIRGKGYQLGVG